MLVSNLKTVKLSQQILMSAYLLHFDNSETGNYQQTFHVITQSNVKIENRDYINPLSNNPKKWSNTLKQFVHKSRRNV